ncbi:LapA family protein [candidate division KSB1 bacterium]|nr:LapA family protein [candidate division KSB1 bacterium]NIR72825.1 LapA family protein [candidate division KSB1 bacterium]NIS26865.1 LapA family protein [candidate division KSB1 bacterium]NIT73661.1 LapA family protein [candidate division KSB1 bacterium]NIU27532.1 LapA family protein [candidate division KSB1 bacterium]
MWAIRWFLAVVVILLVFGFALQNTNQLTRVVFLHNVWEYHNVQLWMVIYVSFGLGVLFWLIVSVFQVLQLKSEIRKLKKKNLEMQHELESLRNLPISEEETGFDIKEET